MCKVLEDMRYESWQEGVREGKKEGIKEGIKEGVKEGIMSTALRMLQTGKYALDEITSISGLSLEEVQKLKTDKNIL